MLKRAILLVLFVCALALNVNAQEVDKTTGKKAGKTKETTAQIVAALNKQNTLLLERLKKLELIADKQVQRNKDNRQRLSQAAYLLNELSARVHNARSGRTNGRDTPVIPVKEPVSRSNVSKKAQPKGG